MHKIRALDKGNEFEDKIKAEEASKNKGSGEKIFNEITQILNNNVYKKWRKI